jgi:pilus assembly protein CpaB
MARSVTSMTSGRTGRRYVVLALVLALLSAALVYAALSRTGEESGAGAGDKQTVVVAKEAIPARSEIVGSMVELRQVPINAAGDQALASLDAVVGRVTRYPISANEQLLASKIVSPDLPLEGEALSYVVPEGMRAVSITASQVLSAGGLVLPGDYVDILWDYPQKGATVPLFARTIVQNVEVAAVAQTLVDVVPSEVEEENGEPVSTGSTAPQRARNSEAEPQPEAVTLTLLVTPHQAQTLFLAEETGGLRAVLRSFSDGAEVDVPVVTLLELLPLDTLPPELVPILTEPWQQAQEQP